jgi:hypothetical protein
MDNEKELEKAESFNGLIFPYLGYLYRIFLLNIFQKYKLFVNQEFWYLLSLSIFSFIILFFGIDVWVPVLFLIGAIIIFLSYNLPFIKRKILPPKSEIIEEFLATLDKKTLSNVTDFIKNYPLEDKQIKEILSSRFGDNYDIYNSISKYQDFESEIIEFIIDSNKIDIMGEELFCDYLRKSWNRLTLNYYKRLREITSEKQKIQKNLSILYPFYLSKNNKFRSSVNFYYKIRSFIQGPGFGVLFISSMIIVTYFYSLDPSIFAIDNPNIDVFLKVFLTILVIILTTMIFMLFCLVIPLKLVLKFYKWVLFRMAPKNY